MKRNSDSKSKTRNRIWDEISLILESMNATLSSELVAERARAPKNCSSCCGLIKVFKKEDLLRQSHENEFKAIPVETYAFYEDTLVPGHLGSVAIYTATAYVRSLILKRKGILFGRRIKSVNLECGRRPFVDVVF